VSITAFEQKFSREKLSNLVSLQTLRVIGKKLKPFAILLIVWELVIFFHLVDPSTLPHTYEVGETLITLIETGAVYTPVKISLYRMALAFVLAAAVGIPVGLLMGRFRPVRWFVDPIIAVAFPTPKIVILPMFLIWFGFGSVPVILLAAIGAVFPVMITTSQGARATQKELIWTARSVDMSRRKILSNVVLPSALPQIFNGLQIGLFLSIVVTSVSEMVSSGSGLGQKIILALDYYRTSEAIAFLLVIMIIGIVDNAIFKQIRSHTLNWTEDTNAI